MHQENISYKEIMSSNILIYFTTVNKDKNSRSKFTNQHWCSEAVMNFISLVNKTSRLKDFDSETQMKPNSKLLELVSWYISYMTVLTIKNMV